MYKIHTKMFLFVLFLVLIFPFLFMLFGFCVMNQAECMIANKEMING